MKQLLILLIAVITFASCSSRNSGKRIPATHDTSKKRVRTMQVHGLTTGAFHIYDSSILVRYIDTLLRVGDVVKYASNTGAYEPVGFIIVE